MDENVGGSYDEAAARQAGRRKRGMGDEENTDSVRNVLCGSQDLVETPSLNKCTSSDTRHPQTTATPRGTIFLTLSQTFPSISISFLCTKDTLHDWQKKLLEGNWGKNTLRFRHRHPGSYTT
jgi:hypothetical protein